MKIDCLRGRPAFDRVIKLGLRIPQGQFSLFIRHNDLDESRLGFIFSRKTGKAVKRNRLRRQLRYGLYTYILPFLLCNCDIVVIGKPKCTRHLNWQSVYNFVFEYLIPKLKQRQFLPKLPNNMVS